MKPYYVIKKGCVYWTGKEFVTNRSGAKKYTSLEHLLNNCYLLANERIVKVVPKKSKVKIDVTIDGLFVNDYYVCSSENALGISYALKEALNVK